MFQQVPIPWQYVAAVSAQHAPPVFTQAFVWPLSVPQLSPSTIFRRQPVVRVPCQATVRHAHLQAAAPILFSTDFVATATHSTHVHLSIL